MRPKRIRKTLYVAELTSVSGRRDTTSARVKCDLPDSRRTLRARFYDLAKSSAIVHGLS